MFRNDYVGKPPLRWIEVIAVDKHHDVSVLFNRPRFAKVGSLRPFVNAAFGIPVQLRHRYDGEI